MTSVLNQKSHTRDPNKMRGSKEFWCILFFFCKFYVQFSLRSCRQLWHLIFFRGKKFKTNYLNEHKSVSPKRNAKRHVHLKLTKKFLPYHHLWKTWSYLWTADLILWILKLKGQGCGPQGWVRMFLNVIVIIILKNWNVLTRIHYKTLTTVF